MAARIFVKRGGGRHGLSTHQPMGHGAYMLPWWLAAVGVPLGAAMILLAMRLAKRTS